ncbi:hypothetical protein BH11PLA1_BH11PLA1_11820 [soil metagenome]
MRGAFTLIEILIVVVILGILAAIAIPQFARASQDAKLTCTLVDLGKIRRAVDVYRCRNESTYPPIEAGTATWGPLVGVNSEYMLQAPTNQYISGANSRKIILRDTPDTAFQSDYGWIFSPATGQVWAASFSDADAPLLP